MNIYAARCVQTITALMISVLLLCVSSSPSVALETTTVKTTFSPHYTVTVENSATVEIGITFVNDGLYPTVLTTYDLFIGDVDPVSITASRGDETLATEVQISEGNTIHIDMADMLLRVGDTQTIVVSYTVSPFFVSSAGTYDAELPPFRTTDSSSLESLVLTYDDAFGPVNYIAGDCIETSLEGNYVVTCTKLADSSRIFVSVGEQKQYSLAIERSFDNPQDGFIKSTILIPPDLNTQQLVVTLLSSYPSDASYSPNSNYLLTYDVPAHETMWVRFQGILVEKLPRVGDNYLSSSDRQEFLRTEEQWWNITDPEILERVTSLTTDLSFEEKVKAVYDFTQRELVLSEGFRNLHGDEFRKGAEVAIKTYKNASVEDFADVFVAVSRLSGIPARIVSGYVFPYEAGGRALGMYHVWPQYWSEEKGWISVDPAYEAYTNLPNFTYVGLNRVIVSASSELSTSEDFPETTEEIIVTDQSVTPSSLLSVDMSLDHKIQAGTVNEGVLHISNDGNTILNGLSLVNIETSDITVTIDSNEVKSAILPGETIDVSFTIDPLDWYVSGPRTLSFIVVAEAQNATNRVTVSDDLSVAPLWWVEPLSWLITIVAFAIFLGTLRSGSWIGTKLLALSRKKKEVPGTIVSQEGVL